MWVSKLKKLVVNHFTLYYRVPVDVGPVLPDVEVHHYEGGEPEGNTPRHHAVHLVNLTQSY